MALVNHHHRLSHQNSHPVHADFLGPILGTHQSRYLLVIIDCYSRFPGIETVSSTSANTVIPKFDRIFATHGIPVKIKTDNGAPPPPPFQSEEIDRYMKTWGYVIREFNDPHPHHPTSLLPPSHPPHITPPPKKFNHTPSRTLTLSS